MTEICQKRTLIWISWFVRRISNVYLHAVLSFTMVFIVIKRSKKKIFEPWNQTNTLKIYWERKNKPKKK